MLVAATCYLHNYFYDYSVSQSDVCNSKSVLLHSALSYIYLDQKKNNHTNAITLRINEREIISFS